MRIVAAFCLACSLAASAAAQPFARPYRPSPALIAELDAAGRKQLELARLHLAEKQWAEAVEAIRRLAERHRGRLIAAEGQGSAGEFVRYVPVERFVQDELRRWIRAAPEAAAVYRELTETRAAELLAAGAFPQVMEQFAATAAADEARIRVGDAAVERGELIRARAAYREVSPDSVWSAGARRRLVWASLVEGDRERALRELKSAPAEDAAGDDFTLAKLKTLERAAASWPQRSAPNRGTTFAVDETRQGRLAGRPFVLGDKPRWSVKLPRVTADREVIGTGRPRLADELHALQVYHPLITGEQVLLRYDAKEQSSLIALGLADGAERWRQDREFTLPENVGPSESPELLSDAHRGLGAHFGAARYTLTSSGALAFARLGSPITAPAERKLPRVSARDQGSLVAVDLRAEGRPAEGFPLFPDGPEWAFEGPPLVAERKLFVAMTKREGTRRGLYVACYERLTTPLGVTDERGDGRFRGRLLWRTPIATGDTVGGGDVDEITHTLLARQDRLLFVGSGLGAVAALDEDGGVRWVTRYPRAPFTAEPAPGKDESYFRELTPPVVHRGRVIFAPPDCEQLFALDAATGEWQWSVTSPAESVHLLGAAEGVLVTSGRGVQWIDVGNGQVLSRFRGAEGLGRGCLRGEQVLFPTRQSLFVLPLRPDAAEAKPLDKLNLISRGATGGNLIAGPGVLLVATGTELFAFDLTGQGGPP